MSKPSSREELLWYYLTNSLEDKEIHTFPKGICPKVNVIARLEFELALICNMPIQEYVNPETQKHSRLFSSGTNLFITLELKGLSI